MPRVPDILEFKDGLAAPHDIPPHKAKNGLVDSINVCLSDGGELLESIPGFRRAYPFDFANDADTAPDGTDTIAIYSLPPQAVGATRGRVLVCVDNMTGRPLRMLYHSRPLVHDSALTPIHLGNINRMTEYDVPEMVYFRGKIFIYSAWDVPYVWDGQSFREQGLRGPHLAPVVQTAHGVCAISCLITDGSGGYNNPALSVDANWQAMTFWKDFEQWKDDSWFGIQYTADSSGKDPSVRIDKYSMLLTGFTDYQAYVAAGDFWIVYKGTSGRVTNANRYKASVGYESTPRTLKLWSDKDSPVLDYTLNLFDADKDTVQELVAYINANCTNWEALTTAASPADMGTFGDIDPDVYGRRAGNQWDGILFGAPTLSLGAGPLAEGSEYADFNLQLDNASYNEAAEISAYINGLDDWAIVEYTAMPDPASDSMLEGGGTKARVKDMDPHTEGRQCATLLEQGWTTGCLVQLDKLSDDGSGLPELFVATAYNDGCVDLSDTDWNTVGEIVDGAIAHANWYAIFLDATSETAVFSAGVCLLQHIDPSDEEDAPSLITSAGQHVNRILGVAVKMSSLERYHANSGLGGEATWVASVTFTSETYAFISGSDWFGLTLYPEVGSISGDVDVCYTASIRIKIPDGVDYGTIPMEHKRLKIVAIWDAYDYYIKNSLAIVFFANNDGTGDEFEVVLESLAGSPRTETTRGLFGPTEVAISLDADFDYKSVGIRRKISLPTSQFSSGLDTLNSIAFRISHISTFVAAATDTGIQVEGDYSFAFTWFDSTEKTESAISPPSEVIRLGLGKGFLIDFAAIHYEMDNGMWNVPPDAADQVRLYINNEEWALDPFTGNQIFRRILTVDIPALRLASPTFLSDRQRVMYVQQEIDDALIMLGLYPPRHNEVPPSVNIALVDNDRILLAGQPPFGVGRVKATQESHVVVKYWSYIKDSDSTQAYYLSADRPGGGYTLDPSLTPNWGQWLEGRQIRIGSDAEMYLILKVLDQDGDGENDALYIERGAKRLGYIQSNAAEKAYRVIGHNSRIWATSKTSRVGVNAEAVPLMSFLDLEVPDDEITAMSHAGDWVVVTTHRYTVLLRQNANRLDDLIVTGSLFPRPRIFEAPGAAGKRLITATPGDAAVWLTPSGNIGVVTPSGFSFQEEVSEKIRGWISNPDNLSHPNLKHGHCIYVPNRKWIVFFFMESTANGVWGNFGNLPTVPTDSHIAWSGENPDEVDWDAVVVAQEGLVQSQASSISPDFKVGFIYDLKHNAVFPIYGFPHTCTLRRETQSPTTGRMSSQIYAFNTSGYLDRLFEPYAYGLGNPTSRVVWRLQNGSTDVSLVISPSTESMFLPTNHLKGLTITVVFADGTADESRVVQSNTTTAIVPTVAFSQAPVAGDYVAIAPMESGLIFRERRFRFPAHVANLVLDITSHRTDPQDESFTFAILGASDGENKVDYSNTIATRTISHAQMRLGTGVLGIPNHKNKALAAKLTWMNRGGGSLAIGPIETLLDVSDSEKGRGG